MSPRQREPSDSSVEAAGRRRHLWRLMLQGRIVRSALKVSLVVGTLLNLINNGEALWGHHGVNLWQMALNFIVPYCVSSYSAARNEAHRSRDR
jgi:hypothetical protein